MTVTVTFFIPHLIIFHDISFVPIEPQLYNFTSIGMEAGKYKWSAPTEGRDRIDLSSQTWTVRSSWLIQSKRFALFEP